MKRGNPFHISCPYEVGDVLTTKSEKLPSDRWPGTKWVQVKDRVILAAGDTYMVGQAGGAASVTSGGSSAASTGGTAITTAQMPSHAHLVPEIRVKGKNLVSGTSDYANFRDNGNDAGYGTPTTTSNLGSVQLFVPAQNTNNAGSGQTHTHTMAHTHTVATMPPYTVYYVWERTA